MNERSHTELARVVRDHAGRLAASLVNLVGDFPAAEDLVQDAVEAALSHWPVEGIPDRPDAWLYTVARRRGLDRCAGTAATGTSSPSCRGRPDPDPTTGCG
jgi:predicted RNA polymerase sigma factor